VLAQSTGASPNGFSLPLPLSSHLSLFSSLAQRARSLRDRGYMRVEVVLAVGLLSLMLLIWALFAPPKISRIFDAVSANAVRSVILFFAILIVPWLLCVVVWSVLLALGVVP
jgi:hypothetical protein